MRKSNLKFSGIFAMLVLLFILAFAYAANASEDQWQPPSLIVGASCNVTTPSYLSFSAIATAVTDATGVEFRIIPEQGGPGRTQLLRGAATFVSLTGEAHDVARGINAFEAFGPTDIKLIWNMGPVGQAFFVRADSDIYIPADLKGKKVASYPANPAGNQKVNGLLAFADLTWDDVTEIPFGSTDDGAKGVVSGAADVSYGSYLATYVYDLQASIHGLRWIQMSKEDTEGWARFREVNPILFYYNYNVEGIGVSEENPVEGFGFSYQLSTMADTSDELAYWMTKQINETYDVHKDIYAYNKTCTLEQALKIETWYTPWHPGSIQYFKDIGVWTDEHEAANQKIVEEIDKIRQAD